MKDNTTYSVFKGLQKPLVFKSFKGRFIYWVAGGVLVSFILCIICSLIFGYGIGFAALIVFLGISMVIINNKQKNGLHSKERTIGKIFYQANYKRKYGKK